MSNAAHRSSSMPLTGRGPRRSAVALAMLLAGVLGACSSRPPDPTVRAVEAPRTRRSTSVPAEPTSTTLPDTATSAGPADAPADDAALRSQVGAALLRYDAALTALAADPDRAGDPASAERTAWAGVVVVGSTLDDALVEEVVRRGAEEDGAVEPPPGGLSYRHTALTVRATEDGTEFTWCGHSPGVGVERSTGTVVDDAVGHSHGTGLLVVDGGVARIAELEQTRLDVLAPGTPDPCPGEVRP